MTSHNSHDSANSSSRVSRVANIYGIIAKITFEQLSQLKHQKYCKVVANHHSVCCDGGFNIKWESWQFSELKIFIHPLCVNSRNNANYEASRKCDCSNTFTSCNGAQKQCMFQCRATSVSCIFHIQNKGTVSF